MPKVNPKDCSTPRTHHKAPIEGNRRVTRSGTRNATAVEAAELSITDIGDTATLDPSILAGTVNALYTKMEAANNHKENDNSNHARVDQPAPSTIISNDHLDTDMANDTIDFGDESMMNASGLVLVNPYGGFDSEDDDANRSALVYDAVSDVQAAITAVCVAKFKHEGKSKFKYCDTPSSVGNVFPRKPIVGDSVTLEYRIGDGNTFRVAATAYTYVNFLEDNTEVSTLGWLMSSDGLKKDLTSLCGSKQHHVFGEVTSVNAHTTERGETVTFIVNWSAGQRCSFI